MKIIKVIIYLKESEQYSCSLVLVSSEDPSRMRAELGGERGLVVGLRERCKMGITEQGSLPSSPFTPASSTARRQLWVWQDSLAAKQRKEGNWQWGGGTKFSLPFFHHLYRLELETRWQAGVNAMWKTLHWMSQPVSKSSLSTYASHGLRSATASAFSVLMIKWRQYSSFLGWVSKIKHKVSWLYISSPFSFLPHLRICTS